MVVAAGVCLLPREPGWEAETPEVVAEAEMMPAEAVAVLVVTLVSPTMVLTCLTPSATSLPRRWTSLVPPDSV